MQQSFVTDLRLTAICLGLVLVVHFGETEVLGQQKIGSLKADRILFLGNSLTLHGPKAEIGWTGNWGMAASAQDKDFVHLLTAAIDARTGGRLKIEPPPVDSSKSTENVINIASIVEQGYASYQAAKIRRQLDWMADVVIVQCGENVPPNGFDPEAFKKGLQALLNDLKNSSNPQIFVTSTILWGNPGLDEIKRKVCAEDPALRTFVDVSAYGLNIPVNGPVGHPSDTGMKLIADTLFAAICRKADIVELSAAHVAAVNRRRRIYVNNDAGYDAVAMGPKSTSVTADDWIAARFSAFDQVGSQVDCIGWCLDEGTLPRIPAN
ncbi:MAG: hypothetical protein EXS05_23540 [Planctomycetaceae bacterium]|nr:hypothetical protein [Planctomycetaceae bacterium]